MSNSGLPDFNDELGGFLKLPATVKQKYTDVITQVYPLHANMQALEAFCNAYFDKTGDPEGPFRFKPFAPWVLVQVCNYGKMALESQSIGWVSQHELAFGFPVWDETSQDVALVYPFIFVDNTMSLSGGRQIYGWPKAEIHLDYLPPSFEPNNPRCIVSASRTVYKNERNDSLYSSKPDQQGVSQPFLQVFQRRPFLSGLSGVAGFYSSIPKAVSAYFHATSRALDTVGGLIDGYTPPANLGTLGATLKAFGDDVESLGRLLLRFYGYMNAFAPTVYNLLGLGQAAPARASKLPEVRVISLKQFRDADKPSEACFRAIVWSSLQIDRPIDGGLLFDPLSGDLTGGVEIKLRSRNEPALDDIVEKLGIDAAAELAEIGSPGSPAALLRPTIPFWVKMDLSYDHASEQYWRTKSTLWSRTDTPEPAKAQAPTPALTYIERGSGPEIELEGPFTFEKIIFRAFPLRAVREKVSGFCKRYLANEFFDFEVVEPSFCECEGECLVYVLVSDFDQMTIGEENTPSPRGDRVLRFAVPVEWFEKANPQKRLNALIPLYTFVGTDWNFVTDYEVYGRFTIKATLTSPKSNWIKETSPDKDRRNVLTVKTKLFVGSPKQRDQTEKTVPVVKLFQPAGECKTGSGQRVADEKIRALGLDSYFSKEGFYSIALKQIRDAEKCDKAGYQALVGVYRQFVEREDIKDIPPIEIDIYQYDTFDIVEKLALKDGKSGTDDDGRKYITVKPVDFMGINGKMKDKNGLTLCWREGSGNWERAKDIPFAF